MSDPITRFSSLPAVSLLAVAVWCVHGEATAQSSRMEPAPEELDGVGIEEKLGARLPAGLELTASSGERVEVRELFDEERPVLLTLNYSDCPMLCSIQLNGLVEALNQLEWRIGEEYEVVTVSLDPAEPPSRAAETKDKYLNQYVGGQSAASGWHFLVGDEESVGALADAVGFGYRYSEERDEYLHTAAVMVLSPSAKVSRYLYGVQYSPQTVRLSMAEASEGKQVSTLDRVILYCFYYDAEAGSYTPVVRNIMKVGGAVTVVLLGLFVATGFVTMKSRRARRRRDETANGVA